MQSKREHTTSISISSAPSRLMVVDDEADIAFTLKLELELSGFLVDVFNDPKIALSHYKPDYYDLILLDVKMPVMNGFEIYPELQKKDKNVKACFVTADELYYESLKTESPNLNVGCLFRRPIGMDDLVKRINEELFHSNKIG
jgi:DNA-binding response OmpR family regulator